MPVLRLRSRPAYVLLAVLATLSVAADARAQVEAEAVLDGRVLLGDSAMRSGTVVLHRVSDSEQGEIDSMRVMNGEFAFRLPGVPNPTLGDIYFASVRHQGVMYFGPPITQAIELDSAYVIQAWDTLLAPAEGMEVDVEVRSMFFDPQGESWTITDVFQLHNELDRTIVARPEGRVWTYPLPAAATDVTTGENEMSADVITYEDGRIVVRGALPPGERMFVVRYTLPSPEVSIPTPGSTLMVDVLVREPAPPLEVTGLSPGESVAFEGGITYRRFSGDSLSTPSIDIVLGEETAPPPVQWIAVILAVVLAGGGLLALRARSARAPAVARTWTREDLLLEVARLDDAYQGQSSPPESVTQEYRARRAALLRRLREGA
ncbi:MAG: hypothetical protein AB7T31_17225 [Gemmatimonadales bacterium]